MMNTFSFDTHFAANTSVLLLIMECFYTVVLLLSLE